MGICEGGELLFQNLQVGTRALYSRGETGCSCELSHGKDGKTRVREMEISDKASNARHSLKHQSLQSEIAW
jgi:hypothetical protein